MDLNTIKQYAHRIDKVIVTNNNLHSLYSKIIFKVHLDDKYMTEEETIRFSLEPNDNFIEHQRFGNDFFLRIPNSLRAINQQENIQYIYIHYFPSDLYEYEEDEQIFSVYDFRELLEDHPVDQYFGEEYEKTISKEQYDWHVDEEGRLVVRSLLKDSINDFNDPNYKNYIDDNNQNINMTEKGMFPLSSKYRNRQNWIAPNLDDDNPIWEEKTYYNNEMPFWEARIHRNGLSPLITNGLENNDYDAFPLNVFLNYEYLPTSREYHQHYYGFEPETPECKTFNVFEGTNVNRLSNAFGSENNYRIITRDNPYDDSRSMFVPHGYEIPISFKNFIKNKINDDYTCSFEKNECYDFYAYTALMDVTDNLGYCNQTITLNEGEYYSLKFYMYIPSYTMLGNDELCQITVQANPTDINAYWEDYNDDMIQYDHMTMTEDINHSAIYKINDAFLEKGKKLRDEWVFYEIPFKAGSKNIITIYGPQNTYADGNSIFFTHMSLYKMEEYSPTLKYTNTGLYVTEKDQYAFKSAAEEICDPNNPAKDDKRWISTNEELPRPYGQVYMVLDHDTYIEYDDKTSNLYFTHNEDEPLTITHIINDEEDKIRICCDDSFDTKCWYTDDITDNTDDIQRDTNLYASYKDYLTLVRGSNNKIKIKVQDITGNAINVGNVRATIIKDKNKETEPNNTVKNLKEREVNNGLVNWYAINLIDLPHSGNMTELGEKYYLRLEYNNKCYSRPYVEFKPFYVVDEIIDMEVEVNGNKYVDDNHTLIPGQKFWIREAIDQYGEIINFPVVIHANIKDQIGNYKTDGYCELSIDDQVVQTTMVDLDGKADFYLDLEDLHTNCQTIKIEYYQEYYQSVVFKYFKLCIDPSIDLRPAIPIEIKIMTEYGIYDLDSNIVYIDYDDVLLSSISSNYHNDFGLKIERKIDDGEFVKILHKTIYNPYDTVEFLDMEYEPNNYHIVTYRITTGNKVDEQGVEIDNKYREYSRIFTIYRESPSIA